VPETIAPLCVLCYMELASREHVSSRLSGQFKFNERIPFYNAFGCSSGYRYELARPKYSRMSADSPPDAIFRVLPFRLDELKIAIGREPDGSVYAYVDLMPFVHVKAEAPTASTRSQATVEAADCRSGMAADDKIIAGKKSSDFQ
jgi:hypothetical protein